MSTNGTDVVTPVGRLVWGNPLKAQTQRDNNGKPKVDPETGQQKEQWAFGLAIPKDQAGPIFEAMNVEAMGVYPDGQFPPSFAWKYIDGDGIDPNGKSYADREGYAGCFVISFTTYFAAPEVFQRQSAGMVQISEGLKTGDYIRVMANVKGHGVKPGVTGGKPGLYMNPNMVELVGYGEAIRSGPSADQAFGTPAELPPGASATPTASGPMQAPGAPSAPAAPQAPAAPPAAPAAPVAPQAPAAPAAPQAPAAAPAAPGAPAAPPGNPAPTAHYDFLKGPGGQG